MSARRPSQAAIDVLSAELEHNWVEKEKIIVDDGDIKGSPAASFKRRNSMSGAIPTQAAPTSWQVVCGQDEENPCTNAAWDQWDEHNERTVTFEATTVSVLPACESQVADARRWRRGGSRRRAPWP